MDNLQEARLFLSYCCNLSEEAFSLSTNMWKTNTYRKGEKYNVSGKVCKTSSFIKTGYFRTYKLDANGEQRNIFIHPPGQTLVSFVSFVQQTPCEHENEAIT